MAEEVSTAMATDENRDASLARGSRATSPATSRIVSKPLQERAPACPPSSLTDEQFKTLRSYYRKNPDLTRERRKSLAATLHVSEKTVVQWYAENRRLTAAATAAAARKATKLRRSPKASGTVPKERDAEKVDKQSRRKESKSNKENMDHVRAEECIVLDTPSPATAKKMLKPLTIMRRQSTPPPPYPAKASPIPPLAAEETLKSPNQHEPAQSQPAATPISSPNAVIIVESPVAVPDSPTPVARSRPARQSSPMCQQPTSSPVPQAFYPQMTPQTQLMPQICPPMYPPQFFGYQPMGMGMGQPIGMGMPMMSMHMPMMQWPYMHMQMQMPFPQFPQAMPILPPSQMHPIPIAPHPHPDSQSSQRAAKRELDESDSKELAQNKRRHTTAEPSAPSTQPKSSKPVKMSALRPDQPMLAKASKRSQSAMPASKKKTIPKKSSTAARSTTPTRTPVTLCIDLCSPEYQPPTRAKETDSPSNGSTYSVKENISPSMEMAKLPAKKVTAAKQSPVRSEAEKQADAEMLEKLFGDTAPVQPPTSSSLSIDVSAKAVTAATSASLFDPALHFVTSPLDGFADLPAGGWDLANFDPDPNAARNFWESPFSNLDFGSEFSVASPLTTFGDLSSMADAAGEGIHAIPGCGSNSTVSNGAAKTGNPLDLEILFDGHPQSAHIMAPAIDLSEAVPNTLADNEVATPGDTLPAITFPQWDHNDLDDILAQLHSDNPGDDNLASIRSPDLPDEVDVSNLPTLDFHTSVFNTHPGSIDGQALMSDFDQFFLYNNINEPMLLPTMSECAPSSPIMALPALAGEAGMDDPGAAYGFPLLDIDGPTDHDVRFADAPTDEKASGNAEAPLLPKERAN
ncbi:uncharacterized protein EV422DRAFT_510844 [Fimicolochytrium jonesii]|uniref:uncharacterized protein n=1 Tax=Fimicolochytrium jonesii TaxID=1396493 RepID=UPI0022FE934C|nr:uncharacterized protein EV422DRAFT_510844 [Fimicolochytrium jonesii]KAI8826608.1 hypothetical protein EV422DRAFT_510844 [Fimicolochytrium jonesii]